MLPFLGDLNVDKLRVQAPSDVVFLCGGPWEDDHDKPIASMRDAFLRVADHPSLRKRDVLKAEDISKQYGFSSLYQNLLDFENDIAQITELILLFCESEGSFAELGSFVMIPEIEQRLLVVVREKDWQFDSFIKLGPLKRLLKKPEERKVFVVNDQMLGVSSGKISETSLSKFRSAVDSPLRQRLEILKEPSTFDAGRSGHLIKLMVGFVQEFGALTRAEIIYCFNHFSINITDQQIEAYALCAKSVGWIDIKTIGFTEYITSESTHDAAIFTIRDDAEVKDRKRRRVLIREEWAKHDPERFQAFTNTEGSTL